ncbi:thiamine pyrophosphokinase [Pedobacter sp. BS3]|uniref:thiamine pyrophosphokinase n=1 Tax=Pedobacter sp. BS3 TaxID=2567937 RepID=UPI0011EC232E|nr:thiamine pyrophosphokinase [Pedobacter sp. BS3]TZF82040.1 thiamine pyrophosphokinase [Pedobacter sp. BS3]
MSSHHIVREKQEPALLIIDLEDFNHEHLGQLLEWSPTVMVSYQAYEHADSLGVKIDAVLTPDEHFPAQAHTLVLPTEDDPLSDGLKYFVGEQYPSVNIITNTFAVKDYALFVHDIDLVVYTPHKKIFPVRSGFSKWKTAGESIEIIIEPAHLQTSGLEHIDGHCYKTVKDGFYSLCFSQEFIFIAESI